MLSSVLHRVTPISTSQVFASGFFTPISITEDSNGTMYVIDSFGDTYSVTQQAVKTHFVGNYANQGFADGTGAAAIFNQPTAAVCDASGNVYIADNGNAKIRKATTSAVVTTLSNFYQIGVREMAVNPDATTIYTRSSNSGDTSTTSNITYYTNGSNYGTLQFTSGLAYPEDGRATTISYNQNGNVYFCGGSTSGSSTKLYRIGTPSVSSNTTSLAPSYIPVTVNVNNYPGSNLYTTYTQFSNVYLASGTILIFNSFGGQWTGLNGRTFTVGFSNISGDAYPLGGTFISLIDQLYNVGTIGMAVNVSNTTTHSNSNTTAISNAWTINSYFGSGGNMLFSFSNSLASIVSGGQVVITGLTGIFAPYNSTAYTMTDCNSTSSPYQYQITVTSPSGSIGKTASMTTFSVTAAAIPVTGVPATLSNLFSPTSNELTAMSSGYLQKYTLSGDVATQVYTCNVSLYNGIGGVPNLASTLVPEVYTLVSSAGQILCIRNTY